MRSTSAARVSLVALLLLAGCRRAEDLPSLLHDLSSKDAERREGAAWSLARVAERQPGATRAALEPLARAAANDAAPRVRVAALRALGAIGPAAVPALLAAADDPEPSVRLSMGKALITAAPLAAGDLDAAGKLLGHRDWQIRGAAGDALVSSGPAALPVLAAALRDPRRRDVALNALVTMKATAELVAATASDEADLRRYALEALMRIAPPAADVLPTYIRLVGDPDADVRTVALACLFHLGPAAAPALDTLVALLGKTPPVYSVIAAIGPAALPKMTELVATAPAGVALDATRALEGLGSGGRAAAPTLLARATARDTPASLRAAVLRALGRTGLADEDLPKVIAFLADADGDVASAARFVLIERRPASLRPLRDAASGKGALATRARGVLAELERQP